MESGFVSDVALNIIKIICSFGYYNNKLKTPKQTTYKKRRPLIQLNEKHEIDKIKYVVPRPKIVKSDNENQFLIFIKSIFVYCIILIFLGMILSNPVILFGIIITFCIFGGS